MDRNFEDVESALSYHDEHSSDALKLYGDVGDLKNNCRSMVVMLHVLTPFYSIRGLKYNSFQHSSLNIKLHNISLVNSI